MNWIDFVILKNAAYSKYIFSYKTFFKAAVADEWNGFDDGFDHDDFADLDIWEAFSIIINAFVSAIC